jgi:hypothetical protein
MLQPKADPIPQLARATLELYSTSLREVRFPDLDHELLEAAAEELRDAQQEVECIESALEQARGVVREKIAQLNAQADRGLSYARIFAAGNAQLSSRIGEIERLGRTQAQGSPAEGNKKRGRPRKAGQEAGLFGDEAESTAAAQEEAAE